MNRSVRAMEDPRTPGSGAAWLMVVRVPYFQQPWDKVRGRSPTSGSGPRQREVDLVWSAIDAIRRTMALLMMRFIAFGRTFWNEDIGE